MAVPLKTLRVLGRNYRIEVNPSRVDDDELDERPRVGVAAHRRGLIRIDGTLDGDYQLEVLLHEVIHCADIAIKSGLKEKQVMRLGRALFSILRDNAKFVRLFLVG